MLRIEGLLVQVWFFACVIGGSAFLAMGARAAGLALLAAVVGAFLGALGAAQPEQLPFRLEVGATIGVFVVGLVGLAWRPRSYSDRHLRALGAATIVVGVLSGLALWVESQRVCGRFGLSCLRDFSGVAFALFALDVAWIAALCFIQAAQSNRTDVRHAHAT